MEYPLATLLAALGLGVLLLIDRGIFGDQRADQPQSLYPYVLLVLLSIHSVIAGISLGLEPHLAASSIITLGILCYKASAAFALMVSIHVAGFEASRQKRMLAVFVSMTPLGILLGLPATTGLDETSTTMISMTHFARVRARSKRIESTKFSAMRVIPSQFKNACHIPLSSYSTLRARRKPLLPSCRSEVSS